MKRSLTSLLTLLIIVCCFLQNNAFSETRGRAPKKKIKLAKINDVAGFDLACDKLPPSFSGHDAIKTYKALMRRRDVVKDEYETTELFEKRLAYEHAKPILGKMTADDIYAFMIKPDTEYDAGKGSLRLLIHKKSNLNGSNFLNDIGIPVLSSKTISNSVAKNAFNSTIVVKHTENVNLNLNLSNSIKQFNWTYKYKYYEDQTDRSWIQAGMNDTEEDKIEIVIDELPLNITKKFTDDINILFIVKLASPWTSYGSAYGEATYLDPFSNAIKDSNIHCTVYEIWAYNFKTGTVLKRIKVHAPMES